MTHGGGRHGGRRRAATSRRRPDRAPPTLDDESDDDECETIVLEGPPSANDPMGATATSNPPALASAPNGKADHANGGYGDDALARRLELLECSDGDDWQEGDEFVINLGSPAAIPSSSSSSLAPSTGTTARVDPLLSMLSLWRRGGLDVEQELDRMNRMGEAYLPMRCPCGAVVGRWQQSLERALCLGAAEGRRRCGEMGIKEKHGVSIIKASIEDAREGFARRLCCDGVGLPFRAIGCDRTCCLRFILAFPFKLDTGSISSSSDDDDNEGHGGLSGSTMGGRGTMAHDADTLFA